MTRYILYTIRPRFCCEVLNGLKKVKLSEKASLPFNNPFKTITLFFVFLSIHLSTMNGGTDKDQKANGSEESVTMD